ncbi:MAG: hypothetical protein K2X93_15035 [Candidatus Obscuribacterales bacterium]|nr:hypothetical protein [Candidatus Obscuribacterales bacterium]
MLPITTSKPGVVVHLNRPLTLPEWLLRLNNHAGVCIFTLIVVNLACHWQTISGFFLADDFGHVSYLNEVFKGHPELLLKNFYSTWLQTEGTNFYRPLISLTLAWDCLLFGFNPSGFHFSNVAFQVLSTIALYLFLRELMVRTGLKQSIVPLLAALVFAVHPLHSEVVSWIIARVDSVCCLFYLFSMWLFFRARTVIDAKKRKLITALALLSFVLSLLSKEMAATLPASLTLLMVLFPELSVQDEGKNRFFITVKRALIATFPMWIVLITYIVFRWIALGSLTGGYQGSIGEGLSSSTLSRILSSDSASRVLFPLNVEIFTPIKRWVRPLSFLYFLSLLLFIARMFAQKNRVAVLRLLFFSALWFLIVMAPAVPVWNLTETLQGSRFIYMGTAPLSLFLAVLLSPFNLADPSAENASRLEDLAVEQTAIGASSSRSLSISTALVGMLVDGLSVISAIALVGIYGYIVCENNNAWVKAGNELRLLQHALVSQFNQSRSDVKLALLNLPHRYKGAHMLYNAATMSVMLAPPLADRDFTTKIATFEPVLFGDEDLVRISRLRKMVEAGSAIEFFRWDRDKKELCRVEIKPDAGHLQFAHFGQDLEPIDVDARGNHIGKGSGQSTASSALPQGRLLSSEYTLISPAIDLQPSGTDFLDICIAATPTKGLASGPANVPVVVEWSTDESDNMDPTRSLITTVPLDGKAYRMRLHVSQHKKWLAHGRIHRLGFLSPAPGAEVKVFGLALARGVDAIAALEANSKGFREDASGVVRAGGNLGRFTYDVSQIAGAKGVLCEISKPNAWFEHYTDTYRDAQPSPKALKSWTEKELSKVDATIDLKKLAGAGFYEIRVAAVDDNGSIIGYFSDPIMFQLSQ